MLVAVVSCKGDDMKEINVDLEKIGSAIEVLQGKTIFFGHQSVGSNILDGIRDLSDLTGKKFNIVSLDSESDFNEANIIETQIGRNFHPNEKIEDFSKIIRSGIVKDVDIAFMKLCYVDSENVETIENLVKQYITVMEELEEEFPETIFVYITMPLTGVPKNFIIWVKNIVKKIVDWPVYGKEDNIKRNYFNDLLKQSKLNKGKLFDLAKFESINPKGYESSFYQDGKKYNTMSPVYTNDGGHLNIIGRKVIAEKLIIYLSEIVD